MTRIPAPAKTPGVAIARVLRALGLKQGTDFRVKGEYRSGERIGTYVSVYGAEANVLVAREADFIEAQMDEVGFHFNVSVFYNRSKGRPWVDVANYGTRTREVVETETTAVETETETTAVETETETTAVETGTASWTSQRPDEMYWTRETAHGTYTLAQSLTGPLGESWFFTGPDHPEPVPLSREFKSAIRHANNLVR